MRKIKFKAMKKYITVRLTLSILIAILYFSCDPGIQRPESEIADTGQWQVVEKDSLVVAVPKPGNKDKEAKPFVLVDKRYRICNRNN